MLFNTSAAAASMKKKNQSSSSSDRNLIIQAMLLVMLVGSPMVVDGQQPGGATERKREQARQKDLQAVQSKATMKPGGEPIQNICDIQFAHSLAAYCLCDSLTLQDASEAKCTVYNVTDQNDPIWESFRTQTHLKELIMTVNAEMDGRLTFLPAVALRHLPNLTSFHLRGADIEAVTSHSLVDAPHIQELQLNQNRIRQIRPFAFHGLSKLSELELSQNELSSLERGAFAGLDDLRSLLLDGNNISLIEDEVFRALPKLTELDLSNNRIGVLTGDTLLGMKHLSKLNLRGNDLTILGDMTFTFTPQLRRLDLSSNRLQVIRDQALVGLNRLYNFNLTSNQLSSLDQAALAPIWLNMINSSMVFNIQGNPLRCDCRLFWIRDLHSGSSSKSLKSTLESVNCTSDETLFPPTRNVLEYLQLVDCLITTTTVGTVTRTSKKPMSNRVNTAASGHHHHHQVTTMSAYLLEDEPTKQENVNENGASLQLSESRKPSAQSQSGGGHSKPVSSVNVPRQPSSSSSSLLFPSSGFVYLLNCFLMMIIISFQS